MDGRQYTVHVLYCTFPPPWLYVIQVHQWNVFHLLPTYLLVFYPYNLLSTALRIRSVLVWIYLFMPSLFLCIDY